MTAMPFATLADLLYARGDDGKTLSLPNSKRTVGTFMNPGGFDIASRNNPVTLIESALLYGYPLDAAKMCLES